MIERTLQKALTSVFFTLSLFVPQLLIAGNASADAERPDIRVIDRAELEEARSQEAAPNVADSGEVLRSAAHRNSESRRKRLPKRSQRLRKACGGVSGRKFPTEYPSIIGAGNNIENLNWGRIGMPFDRLSEPNYADGKNEPYTEDMPSPRMVSNNCLDQLANKPSKYNVSDYVWQWGEFLDHDITHTPTMEPKERFMIQIPAGDRFFDPQGTGQREMKLERSAYHMVDGVRQQVNLITAFVDASNVYGSEDARARELRTLDGTGRLKTSAGNMLPLNVNGFANAPTDHDPTLFIAGDFRANEQVGLTAMHTLFVREHNFWAKYINKAFPRMSGDRVYHMARAIVAAEMQVITYNEFLPLLLGKRAIPAYTGYDANVNPSISNEFATAAYRFGHSMLSSHLLRLDRTLQPTEHGPLLLREAFFSPQRLVTEGGLEPVLRGLAVQRAQEIDLKLVDDVRNFLFGPPGSGGFDLGSLNIQRNREHGLASFNKVRSDLGFPAYQQFSDFSSNPEIVECLEESYASPEDVDLWVGGLSEDHVPGAMMGETFGRILADQFQRLRDGDRFWYQNYLPRGMQKMVANQTLSKIIRRNTRIRREIPENVFVVGQGQQ